jgi:polar amino acid transport system substrate-binding protein
MTNAAVDPRVADLVQAGKIRFALFLPQYTRDLETNELRGLGTGFVALEIGRVIAERIGVEVLVIEQPTPPAAIECLKGGACDVAFLGIEPSRAAQVDFSPPFIQFDYTFLTPSGSLLRSTADADRPGIRIAVVRNHASTMALSRIIKHAELIGAEIPDQAFAMLRGGSVDAFAQPRDTLLDYSAKLPGSRVLEDPYGVNLVGMAVPKGHTARREYFTEFIAQAKAAGLIDRAIEHGGLRGFQVPR